MKKTQKFISIGRLHCLMKCIFLIAVVNIYKTAHAKVVITGEILPYSSSSVNNGGNLASDIKLALHEIGLEDIKLSFQPWSRGLQNIIQGNASAAFPLMWTQTNSEHLYYSTPITYDVQSWYTTPDKSFLDTKPWGGYIACVPRGWLSEGMNNAFIKYNLTIRKTNRLKQCIELLQKGKLDLIPINDRYVDVMPSIEKKELYRLSSYRQNITFYLVAPKTPEGKDFIKKFNKYWLGSQLSQKWQ